jgi:3-hydroxyisobutyrate dehydrogenase
MQIDDERGSRRRMENRKDIGFIGLGTMGQLMALNLVKAGESLTVWNRSADKCEPLRAAGAGVAPDSAAVFSQAGIVILMLADEAAVDAVLTRGTADFAVRVGGHTIIHMGTVFPTYSRELEADIRAAGGRYVEAPVSGSRKPAEAGQLVAMLAGEPATVEAVRPLLAPLCHQTVPCGAVPNALLMKLATNAFLLPTIAALAEAFHLADRFGLDRQQFASVIGGGQLASPISRIKAQKLAAGDFAVQAAVFDALKNNRLAIKAARAAKTASPLLDLAGELYAETLAMGFGQVDLIAVLRAIEARTGDGDNPP